MTKASFVVMMLLLLQQVSGFVLPTPTTIRRQNDMTSLSMDMTSMILEPSSIVTSSVSTFPSSMTILAETEPWVQPLSLVLDPFLNFLSFAMLCRVVVSWYPETKLNESPWIFIAWPTEPLLRLVKGSIPPAFGVDITPVFWLAIFTFIHEILLGQQGLLVMKMKYGI